MVYKTRKIIRRLEGNRKLHATLHVEQLSEPWVGGAENMNKWCRAVQTHLFAGQKTFVRHSYSFRVESTRVAYVTSLPVNGKQIHMYYANQIHCGIRTETGSYKVLPVGNNVYSKDSICFFICYPSHPFPSSSDGPQGHRFAPTALCP